MHKVDYTKKQLWEVVNCTNKVDDTKRTTVENSQMHKQGLLIQRDQFLEIFKLINEYWSTIRVNSSFTKKWPLSYPNCTLFTLLMKHTLSQ